MLQGAAETTEPEATSPDAVTLPPPLEPSSGDLTAADVEPRDEGVNVLEEWWFWTIVGAVVVGGVVAAVLVSTSGDSTEDPMLGTTGVVSRALQ